MLGKPTTGLRILVSATMLAMPCAAHAELSCSRLPLSAIQPRIKSFLLRPETILEQFPRGDQSGTRDMEILIRELVAADMAETLEPISKLVPLANTFQKQAIGTGLGDAARQCQVAARPADARRLIDAAKRSNDQTILTAFMAALIPPGTPVGLGTPDYEPQTNPLGRPAIASPGANVFKDETIHNPFNLNDPFAPVK
jgi:hypothetical protein